MRALPKCKRDSLLPISAALVCIVLTYSSVIPQEQYASASHCGEEEVDNTGCLGNSTPSCFVVCGSYNGQCNNVSLLFTGASAKSFIFIDDEPDEDLVAKGEDEEELCIAESSCSKRDFEGVACQVGLFCILGGPLDSCGYCAIDDFDFTNVDTFDTHGCNHIWAVREGTENLATGSLLASSSSSGHVK